MVIVSSLQTDADVNTGSQCVNRGAGCAVLLRGYDQLHGQLILVNPPPVILVILKSQYGYGYETPTAVSEPFPCF